MLDLQCDNNLVFYGPGGTVEWAVGQGGSWSNIGPFRAVLQPDGNFVRYDSRYQTGDWPATGTHVMGYNSSRRLAVRDDGKVVVTDDSDPPQTLWQAPP